jgi:hypothetical protein
MPTQILKAISNYLTKQGITNTVSETPNRQRCIIVNHNNNFSNIYENDTIIVTTADCSPYYTSINIADPELLPKITKAVITGEHKSHNWRA